MNVPAKNRLILIVVIGSLITPSTHAESLTPEQIKQIEGIAQSIAAQHNRNSKAILDEMTISTRAIAIGRNVKFEYVLRVKKGLSSIFYNIILHSYRLYIVCNELQRLKLLLSYLRPTCYLT